MVVIVVFGDEVVDVGVLGLPCEGAVFGAALLAGALLAGALLGPAATGAAVRDRMVATLIERSRSRMLVSSGPTRGKAGTTRAVRLSC